MEVFDAGGLKFILDLSKPLWEQVLYQIRGAVARGEINPGEKIPSLRDLAQQLKMNPNTVMRAYQELDRDGLTETRRGQGTFITSSGKKITEVRQQLALEAVEEFVSSMRALGVNKAEACDLLKEVEWK